MSKKILVFLLIYVFLFSSSSYSLINKVQAGTDIYPVELAVPHQPLIAGEEADFYIIVNDEEARKRIKYFIFHLNSSGSDGEKIDYNGENYLKITEKIPFFSYDNDLQNIVEAYEKDNDKYIFRIFKNTPYILKYPFGPLPSKFSAGVDNTIKENDFSKIKAEYKEGEYRGLGYNDTSISEYFDTDFEKNLSEEKIQERIKKDKDSLLARLSSTQYHDTTPQVNSEEFSPIDKNIEKIYLTHACNQTHADSVFYDCEAHVYVVLKNADSDNKKLYPFIFRKRATNMAPAKVGAQMNEFNDMVKNFAKNIITHKWSGQEAQDKKQKIVVPNSGNYNPIFKDYNLDAELKSSEIYQQIMAGEEPGVSKPIKKKEKMQDRKFKISFKFNNEATIWNSGVVNTGTNKDTSFSISVNVDVRALDKDKNEISVSDDELYQGLYLLYEIVNPKSQIYFQEAGVDKNKFKVKVDDVVESVYLQSKGPILYKGPFFDTEYVTVALVDKDDNLLTGKYLYKVNMKDAGPQIEMKNNVFEIDDVADSVFKFKINDNYHKNLQCTIKVPYEKYLKNHIPIIKVSPEGKGDVGTYIPPFDCKPNEWISIRVSPPKLSNFDMISELNGLNMWDLQRDTMEGFAMDLVGFGVDARINQLGEKKKLLEGLYTKGYVQAKGVFGKIDNYEKTIRLLDRANGLAGDAQNAMKIMQIKDNVQSHVDDVKKINEGRNAKSTLESAYDFGIAGINIIQSTVGAVAMAPKHIPVVGKYAQKVTGTFSLAFNLMTNVWKGNLEYLSKEKKIDRAQEKRLPYPVMIGVESKDGFKDVDVEVVTVLYTYLEK